MRAPACSLLFLPLGPCISPLWYPVEVPSLPLTWTTCLFAEEGTGQGARDHRASVSLVSVLILWMMMSLGRKLRLC